ncbi:DUF3445 domain-containing protein [Tropicimonas sp. IMCC34043]|uniref:heme-dependent oxidative N-demethylase family protein n=1 Tax=Tropicimonas sp. IMCC34043 TaxID=2248760 RepID=UPI000E27B1B0
MPVCQSAPILNRHVPNAPWLGARFGALPGVAPLDPDDWIWVLDSYSGQMNERERLLATSPDLVLGQLAGAEAAVAELFDTVLERLDARPDFHRERGAMMHCPDGRCVPLDRTQPLATLGRLVQEDLCVLQKPEGADEHVLTAAVLCFPAQWTLAQKLGHPLVRIHRPVAPYDEGVAQRVQRLFDGIQPGRPLWRANLHPAIRPDLFAPKREEDERPPLGADAQYRRSERQCLVRLPESRAVVFSIHTMMLRQRDLAGDGGPGGV